jgi:hypothetical protein
MEFSVIKRAFFIAKVPKHRMIITAETVNWQAYGRKWWWPILGNHSSTCLKKLSKITLKKQTHC